MNNYIKTLINRMSKLTKTEITEEHMKVLLFAYEYYEANQVGPLYQNISRNTGATKRDIERLFPEGLQSVYAWVGIPIHTTSDICKPAPSIYVDDYREVYLDHNATTYIRPEISRLLIDYFSEAFGYGNPSSSTQVGKQSYEIMHVSRKKIAKCLKVDPKEIIFTGGGSESNNTAIKGVAFQHFAEKGHFIVSKVEHPSILETMHFLEQLGFDVTYLDVDREGRVSPEAVRDHLRADTRLAIVMAANNEIGTVNPIKEIGAVCREAGVPLMVDAIQAFGRIPLYPKEMGISMMAMSGHKIYAPKGVGALYKSDEIAVTPLIHGGEQEFGLRAGTENVGFIAALGEAARLMNQERQEENKRLLKLRTFFLEELRKIEPDLVVNGSLKDRLPHNLNIGFPRIDSGALLLSLNQIGVYVSSGSACHSGSTEASHVLRAIGLDTEHYGSIRFSFGLRTTMDDLRYVLKYLPIILEKLKSGE